MTFCAITFLCLALPGADPVSAEELQIAAAVLDEQLSGLVSIEVVYRVRYEWAPKDIGARLYQLPEEGIAVWIRKPKREYYAHALARDPTKLRQKWVYDGETTHEWNYNPESFSLADVSIRQGPPRYKLQRNVSLALIIGDVSYLDEGNIASYLKSATQKSKIVAMRTKDGLDLSLGATNIRGVNSDVILTVDPANNYRLVGWRTEQEVEPPLDLVVWRYVIDEFQSVVNELTGKQAWFPRRAHIENMVDVTRIEVQSVRINHNLADNHFVHQTPPFGMKLREMPSIEGAPERQSLVGGEAAHQKALNDLVKQAKNENERLDRDGVIYNATPPQSSVTKYWLLASISCFLVVVCLCRMFRLKR